MKYSPYTRTVLLCYKFYKMFQYAFAVDQIRVYISFWQIVYIYGAQSKHNYVHDVLNV